MNCKTIPIEQTMKKSRFSEEQTIGILKEYQTEALEAGNTRLKKLLVESMMDVSTLRERLGASR